MHTLGIEHAVVQQQDPDNYGLFVMILGLGGGQMTTLPVKVSTHGPRDAVRGHFPPLPLVGQTGIVVFARGDIRNGVWIGSCEPALNDASPYSPQTVGIDYAAHHDGGWSLRDATGNVAEVLADGSKFTAGAPPATPTRHTVDQNQNRQRTPFTQAERVPSPPSAFPFAISLASGVQFALDASGDGTVTFPAGKSVTLNFGGATLTFDGTGKFNIVDAGGGGIKSDGSGNPTVYDATGAQIVFAAGLITASIGGTAQPVKLADNSDSTVLMAQ